VPGMLHGRVIRGPRQPAVLGRRGVHPRHSEACRPH
jgi:hypothetical protein